jgi:D-alanyl-lipoteichoic acid acyltransferase DltB (MBOAT superfamily)
MLFNSPVFICLFLPITLLLFFQIGGRGWFRLAIAWLLAASLIFYSWWNPANLILLLTSILVNYGIGVALAQVVQPKLRKILLVLGVAVNLALIGYFKYANFFISSVAHVLGANLGFVHVILPLGISFFTFQQIMYLVDAYRTPKSQSYRLLDYALFVSFFPQLIAGPLVHHRQLIDQFNNKAIYRFNSENLALGITIFVIGLFKKVILADGVALYSTQAFAAATNGISLTFVEAWVGALAFTLQLYFDFSGYSDMAIGLARMVGIQLPINFNSPYKAVDMIDFWRRWHITLSNFLRDYLYIPLGGNRKS